MLFKQPSPQRIAWDQAEALRRIANEVPRQADRLRQIAEILETEAQVQVVTAEGRAADVTIGRSTFDDGGGIWRVEDVVWTIDEDEVGGQAHDRVRPESFWCIQQRGGSRERLDAAEVGDAVLRRGARA